MCVSSLKPFYSSATLTFSSYLPINVFIRFTHSLSLYINNVSSSQRHYHHLFYFYLSVTLSCLPPNLSIYLSVSLSFSFSLTLLHTLSPSLSLSLPRSISLSVFSLPPSVSISHYLCCFLFLTTSICTALHLLICV